MTDKIETDKTEQNDEKDNRTPAERGFRTDEELKQLFGKDFDIRQFMMQPPTKGEDK